MTTLTPTTSALRLSVSTWSLHRTLGQPAFYGAEQGHAIPTTTHGKGSLSLLELPARLAAFGIHTLEICHFHLPRLDSAYLAELRGALEKADVELFSFLVDDGDVTDPRYAERDLAWIISWIDVASQLGAKRIRVMAGKAEASASTLDMSYQALRQIVTLAEARGLRVMTENWYNLLSRPDAIHALLNRLEGHVGLCFDFGNWDGPNKYADLTSIASLAESCHAKAHFTAPSVIDADDFERCLAITQSAHFSGPYTLIYAGPDADEWEGLTQERQILQPYLQQI